MDRIWQTHARKSQSTLQAMVEKERAKQLVKEPKKTLHPDEPWLDYDPKTHAGLRKR